MAFFFFLKLLSSIDPRVITNASFLGIRKITHNKLWQSSLGRKEEQMPWMGRIKPVGEPSVPSVDNASSLLSCIIFALLTV